MLILGLILVALLPVVVPIGVMDFLIKAWITIIAVLGLTLLTGNCGQISLGHTAFMAVGAFVGAILFVFSDSVIALCRFRTSFARSGMVIVSTYFLAQFLIALSTFHRDGERAGVWIPNDTTLTP